MLNEEHSKEQKPKATKHINRDRLSSNMWQKPVLIPELYHQDQDHREPRVNNKLEKKLEVALANNSA